MSDLKPCNVCEKLVSTSAESCPNCGEQHPTFDGTQMNKLFVLKSLVIIIVLLFMFMLGLESGILDKVEKLIKQSFGF